MDGFEKIYKLIRRQKPLSLLLKILFTILILSYILVEIEDLNNQKRNEQCFYLDPQYLVDLCGQLKDKNLFVNLVNDSMDDDNVFFLNECVKTIGPKKQICLNKLAIDTALKNNPDQAKPICKLHDNNFLINECNFLISLTYIQNIPNISHDTINTQKKYCDSLNDKFRIDCYTFLLNEINSYNFEKYVYEVVDIRNQKIIPDHKPYNWDYIYHDVSEEERLEICIKYPDTCNWIYQFHDQPLNKNLSLHINECDLYDGEVLSSCYQELIYVITHNPEDNSMSKIKKCNMLPSYYTNYCLTELNQTINQNSEP